MTFFYDVGRTHKSFFGSPAACFERYKTYCEKENAPSKSVVRSSTIFHRERKAKGLGIEMGYACAIHSVAHIHSDAYTCVKITELKELTEQRDLLKAQRPNQANRAKLKEIEAQMKPLTQFLDEAKRQRAAIRKEVGTNSSSC